MDFQLFVLGVLVCNGHVEKVEMVVVLVVVKKPNGVRGWCVVHEKNYIVILTCQFM